MEELITKYAKYIIEESSTPIDEIEYLIYDLLDSDKKNYKRAVTNI